MSSTAWILILVLLLTVIGSVTLLLITVKYYWGERGSAPLTGEARQRQLREELERRAKQFEYRDSHPREPRNPSFFDNRKRPAR